MGYNTSILILNDSLDAIKKDEQFGKRLADGILESYGRPSGKIDVRAGMHMSAVSIIAQHHADVKSLIMVGGNYGREIERFHYEFPIYDSDRGKLAILRKFAWQLGYRVVKKPERG